MKTDWTILLVIMGLISFIYGVKFGVKQYIVWKDGKKITPPAPPAPPTSPTPPTPPAQAPTPTPTEEKEEKIITQVTPPAPVPAPTETEEEILIQATPDKPVAHSGSTASTSPVLDRSGTDEDKAVWKEKLLARARERELQELAKTDPLTALRMRAQDKIASRNNVVVKVQLAEKVVLEERESRFQQDYQQAKTDVAIVNQQIAAEEAFIRKTASWVKGANKEVIAELYKERDEKHLALKQIIEKFPKEQQALKNQLTEAREVNADIIAATNEAREAVNRLNKQLILENKPPVRIKITTTQTQEEALADRNRKITQGKKKVQPPMIKKVEPPMIKGQLRQRPRPRYTKEAESTASTTTSDSDSEAEPTASTTTTTTTSDNTMD